MVLLNLDKLTVNYWESLQPSVNCLLQDPPFIGRQFWAKINPNQGVASQRKINMYIKEDEGYDSFSDVGEIRVYWRADFQSGSRVLKKVF